jgi:hypothetical protein
MQDSQDPVLPDADLTGSIGANTLVLMCEFNKPSGIGGAENIVIMRGPCVAHASIAAARSVEDKIKPKKKEKLSEAEFRRTGLVSFNGQPCHGVYSKNEMSAEFDIKVNGNRAGGDTDMVHKLLENLGNRFGRSQVKAVNINTLSQLYEDGIFKRFDICDFTLGNPSFSEVESELTCLIDKELWDNFLFRQVEFYNVKCPDAPISFDSDGNISITIQKPVGAHDVLGFMSGFLVANKIIDDKSSISIIDVGVDSIMPCSIQFFAVNNGGVSQLHYVLLIPGPANNAQAGLESKLAEPDKNVFGMFILKQSGQLIAERMNHTVKFDPNVEGDMFAAEHWVDPTTGYQFQLAVIENLLLRGIPEQVIYAVFESNAHLRHLLLSLAYILGLKKPNSLVGQCPFDLSYGPKCTAAYINLSARQLADACSDIFGFGRLSDDEVIQFITMPRKNKKRSVVEGGGAGGGAGGGESGGAGGGESGGANSVNSNLLGGYFTKKKYTKKYIGGGHINISFNTPNEFLSKLFKYLYVNNDELYDSILINLTNIDDCFDFFGIICYNTTVGNFYLSKVTISSNGMNGGANKSGNGVNKSGNENDRKRKRETLSKLAESLANASSVSAHENTVQVYAEFSESQMVPVTTDGIFPYLIRVRGGKSFTTPDQIMNMCVTQSEQRSPMNQLECAMKMYDITIPHRKRVAIILLHDIFGNIGEVSNFADLIGKIVLDGSRLGHTEHDIHFMLAYCFGVDEKTPEEDKDVVGIFVINKKILLKAHELVKTKEHSEHYFMGFKGKSKKDGSKDPQDYRFDENAKMVYRHMKVERPLYKVEKTLSKDLTDEIAACLARSKNVVGASNQPSEKVKLGPRKFVHVFDKVGNGTGRSPNQPLPLKDVTPPPSLTIPGGHFTMGAPPNKNKTKKSGKSGKGGKGGK